MPNKYQRKAIPKHGNWLKNSLKTAINCITNGGRTVSV